jgi:DNA-directed RNA polymerase II subunit RPB2
MSNIDNWNEIDAYFKTNAKYFSRHQIESFDTFLNKTIPSTVKTFESAFLYTTDDYIIQVYVGGEDGKSIRIMKPYMNGDEALLPNIARLQSKNYTADIFVDITVKYTNKKGNKSVSADYTNIRIGKIPIMLHTSACFLNDKTKTELNKLGECPFDQGGYFIVDGKEKVIISQERIAPNKLFLSVPTGSIKDYSLKGECRSVSADNKLFTKVLQLYVMKKSRRLVKLDTEAEAEDIEEGLDKNLDENTESDNPIIIPGHIAVDVMSINLKNIPVFILFRALGIESDKEIMRHILYGDEMHDEKMLNIVRLMVIDSKKTTSDEHIYTQKSALDYLKNFTKFKDIDHVKYVLLLDFLPNMSEYKDKAIFFGYLVNQMIKATIGYINVNSRDNYMNKRVDVSGVLLANVFRDFYNQFRNNAIMMLNSNLKSIESLIAMDFTNILRVISPFDLNRIFSAKFIDEGMYKTFKGNWGMLDDDEKSGIVQDLNRLSYLGYVSHIRRVNTPISRSIKLAEPHRLGTEQFGFMCPFESPDGANIGLLKHMSVTCEITNEIDPEDLIEHLRNNKFIFLNNVHHSEIGLSCIVFLNNNIIGIHKNPSNLYEVLQNLKRSHQINYQITFFFDITLNEFRIYSDSGRCIRPLYIANNEKNHDKIKKKIKNWYDKDFMGKYIEYVDVLESNYLYIAMNASDVNKSHTHFEIHPSLSLSYYTNTIPFVNHNQAPRIVFSGQQGKQAIGVYSTNFNSRIDTASYILHYPQKNLTSTKLAKYVFKDQLPNGENLIVAICTYTGYNQEDSIIVNKSSIDRGMFNVSYFKSLVDEETINDNDKQRFIFQNPIELQKKGIDIKPRFENYNNLNSDGIPIINKYMREGDAMIGKVEQEDEFKNDINAFFSESITSTKYIDKSLMTNKTNYGTIDSVYMYKKDKENKLKLRIRKMRRPVLGDKLASMHGQKGVCGMILPQVEMPFTKDGLVPDIIINPHAIPSRMTIGHLLECVVNRYACNVGREIDGTAYDNHDTESYFEKLQEQGVDRHSNEIMYNARTGEQLKTDIFVGPTYYYRLKHMVNDKINYRDDKGPIENMTKQPTEGRGNGGGLRIGEMETNAIIAHGISSFLNESLMERADGTIKVKKTEKVPHHIYVDENGNDIIYNTERNVRLFSSYEKDTQIKENNRLIVPYCFKLMKQELAGMCVKMKLITDKNEMVNLEEYDDAENEDNEM